MVERRGREAAAASANDWRCVMNRVQWLQEEEIKRLEAMLNMPSPLDVEPSRQEVRAEVLRVRKQKAE